jgi:PAS domain S-box-containing protein
MNNNKVKILLVDDLDRNLLLLEDILEDLDVETITANSGEKAVSIVQEHKFALAILDVQMPGMDGFETLEKIRQTKGNEELPVIFVSGVYTDDNYKIKGLESGAIDFIIKPINQSIFVAKVNVFIDLYHQRKKLYELIETLRKTNIKLEESEKRFKNISMVAFDAIVVIDKEHKITYWNPAAEKIFGYNNYEIQELTFQSLFSSSKYRHGLPDHLKKFIESDQASVFDNILELTALKKNKVEFPIELSISSFHIGKDWHAVCFIRDVTRKQRIEKELLKAKEAKEANKIMREFIDNLNHELRTPLNAIIGISRSLVKYNTDNLSSDQTEALNHISKSGEKLFKLIEQLFEFRKKQEIDIKEFSPDEIINDIEDFAFKSLNNKSVKINIKKEGPLPAVILNDKNKIYQIYINIIENALKFTERGSINIKFSAVDNMLCFEVKDTGVGIDETHLKDIFKKFTQADSTTSRKYGGAGLGLAVANKLVKLLNGEINVKSKLNEGTTFTVKLPVNLTKDNVR